MNTVRFVLRPLEELFERLQAVTMPEMKAVLGTEVDVTVFRKLAQLSYCTSYSHRGSFYTLQSIARFDKLASGVVAERGFLNTETSWIRARLW